MIVPDLPTLLSDKEFVLGPQGVFELSVIDHPRTGVECVAFRQDTTGRSSRPYPSRTEAAAAIAEGRLETCYVDDDGEPVPFPLLDGML